MKQMVLQVAVKTKFEFIGLYREIKPTQFTNFSTYSN